MRRQIACAKSLFHFEPAACMLPALESAAAKTAARLWNVAGLQLKFLCSGREEQAQEKQDATPDGEHPEYLIGQVVNHVCDPKIDESA
ncbi:hypothetical protein [Brucella ovis]|nr:hypothetical protein [Brucella ovis]